MEIGGISPDQINAMLASATASLPQYVNNGDWITRANLKANFPASAAVLGKLARVSDVWGSVRTSLICEFDGSVYYWRPQRTDYTIRSNVANGNMNLIPMVTAPGIVLTTTLLGNVNLVLSNDDVWPGCTFDVTAPGGIFGLNVLQFTGLIGGAVSTLLSGGRKRAQYTSDGWTVS